MKRLISLFLILSLMTSGAFAQENNDIVEETQSDLLMVAAAGAGGAILGLSTLSFYDKPSKHLSNVWTGAAIGIIAGVVIVAVTHAQKSQGDLSTGVRGESHPEFATADRQEWHEGQQASYRPHSVAMSTGLWSTQF